MAYRTVLVYSYPSIAARLEEELFENTFLHYEKACLIDHRSVFYFF